MQVSSQIKSRQINPTSTSPRFHPILKHIPYFQNLQQEGSGTEDGGQASTGAGGGARGRVVHRRGGRGGGRAAAGDVGGRGRGDNGGRGGHRGGGAIVYIVSYSCL